MKQRKASLFKPIHRFFEVKLFFFGDGLKDRKTIQGNWFLDRFTQALSERNR